MTRITQIGTWRGVSIEVAVWDGVRAEAELSCACMMTREHGRAAPGGGLAHLDAALGGALTRLRAAGHYQADLLDTLLVTNPPPGIVAGAILIVGVGDPAAWTPALTARAAACAAHSAIQLGKRSAAFAPGMLDEGIDPAATGNAAPLMMKALVSAIDSAFALAELGLAPRPSLERWVFDVGAPRFDDAVERFRSALDAQLPSPSLAGARRPPGIHD